MGTVFNNIRGMSNIRVGRSRKINLPLLYDESTDTGFYGEVLASQLFTGEEISTTLNLTAGTLHNNNEPWLHFYVGASASCNREGTAYEIYIAKKTFRYNISWDSLNTVGLINGVNIVANNGVTYKCRLVSGSVSPLEYISGARCSVNTGRHSEWNELIYRVHGDIPNCAETTIGLVSNHITRHGGIQVGDNWENYSDSEIGVLYLLESGTASWCYDDYNSLGVFRGGLGIADYDSRVKTFLHPDMGLRPALVRMIL